MAKAVKNHFINSVKKSFLTALFKWIGKWVLLFLGAALFVFALYVLFSGAVPFQTLWVVLLMILSALCLLGFYLTRRARYHTVRALASGYSGERRTRKLLLKLPGDFIVLSDLLLGKNGRIQIDHIVLCPAGVVLIETKNRNGTIRLNNRKSQAKQIKLGRSGREYEQRFHTPVVQSTYLVEAFKTLCKKLGLPRFYVEGAVYFSNRRAIIESKATYPVFYYKKRSMLLKYLMEFSKKGNLLARQDAMEAARILRRNDYRFR